MHSVTEKTEHIQLCMREREADGEEDKEKQIQ